MTGHRVAVCAALLLALGVSAQEQKPFEFKLPNEEKKPPQTAPPPAAAPASQAPAPPAAAPAAPPAGALPPPPVPPAAVAPAATAVPGVSDRFAVVYGNRIHYLESGSGPVLVLLHGLGASTELWSEVIGPLARTHRVIALDQIGHGRSDKPPVNYRVGTLVDFLDGFLRALDVERATLVGHSLGGWVASSFAIARPDRVDRLVLVDSGGFALPAGAEMRGLNPSTRAGVKANLSAMYHSNAFWSDEAVEREFTRIMSSGSGGVVEHLLGSIARGEDVLDGRLGAIRAPTLIVWGGDDRVTPVENGRRFAAEIAGSRLVVLENCGHRPQVERPADLAAAIGNFVK